MVVEHTILDSKTVYEIDFSQQTREKKDRKTEKLGWILSIIVELGFFVFPQIFYSTTVLFFVGRFSQ
jgi:hypothetical protein